MPPTTIVIDSMATSMSFIVVSILLNYPYKLSLCILSHLSLSVLSIVYMVSTRSLLMTTLRALKSREASSSFIPGNRVILNECFTLLTNRKLSHYLLLDNFLAGLIMAKYAYNLRPRANNAPSTESASITTPAQHSISNAIIVLSFSLVSQDSTTAYPLSSCGHLCQGIYL